MNNNNNKMNNNNNNLFNQIWNICNKLRGKWAPLTYKYIILTILFLKFTTIAFKRFEKEKAKKAKSEANNTLFVSEKCKWDSILNKSSSKNIPIIIDDVLREMEDNNKKIRGLLYKEFEKTFGEDQDWKTLKQIIDAIDLIHENDRIDINKDVFGSVYEFFLKKFGKQDKQAGEYYTPKNIVQLMVKILDPDNFDNKSEDDNIYIYDPTVGSGGMFIQSEKMMKQHKYFKFYGQEINKETYTLGSMNLIIRGLDFDFGGKPENTLIKDLHNKHKFDIVIANPPFNIQFDFKEKQPLIEKSEERFEFGIPKEKKANYFFLQHMIYKMNDNGRMAVLLDNGSTTSNASKHIRKAILKSDLYEAIIELPKNIFYNTSIAATLYILNKQKKNPNKVLFIDASNEYIKVDKYNEISAKNVEKIAKCYKNYQEKKDVDEELFSKVVTNEEIINNLANLSPRQYIKSKEIELDPVIEYNNTVKEIKHSIIDIEEDFKELLNLIEKNKNF